MGDPAGPSSSRRGKVGGNGVDERPFSSHPVLSQVWGAVERHYGDSGAFATLEHVLGQAGFAWDDSGTLVAVPPPSPSLGAHGSRGAEEGGTPSPADSARLDFRMIFFCV